jgi:ATP-dependent Lon protease
MTGEVTLTGRVLPVGGIREKLLAAHRHGLFDIVLPAKNRQDSDELPEEIQAELTLHFVEHIDEVLAHMLA